MWSFIVFAKAYCNYYVYGNKRKEKLEDDWKINRNGIDVKIYFLAYHTL